MKTKAAIVVPNWNGQDFISRCLTSLEAQTSPADIIVVDNGSTDNSVNIIKSKHPKVKILELEENTGFTGGVNHGIKYAMASNYDVVALFNSDAVANKDWLKQLLRELGSADDIGAVTGKLMRSDKIHIDSTGDFYTVWGLPFPRGRNHKDTGQYDKPEYVFGASGGASLYRVSLFKDIGLFDEDFFAYYEDVDISFRAQMAGWKVRYTPKAIAYHDVGSTSSKMGDFTRYHSAKNFLLLYARNMPTKLYFKYMLLFGLQFVRLLLGSLIHRKPHVFLKGAVDAIRLHSNTVSKRRSNIAKQKVQTKYIDHLILKSRPPRIPTIET